MTREGWGSLMGRPKDEIAVVQSSLLGFRLKPILDQWDHARYARLLAQMPDVAHDEIFRTSTRRLPTSTRAGPSAITAVSVAKEQAVPAGEAHCRAGTSRAWLTALPRPESGIETAAEAGQSVVHPIALRRIGGAAVEQFQRRTRRIDIRRGAARAQDRAPLPLVETWRSRLVHRRFAWHWRADAERPHRRDRVRPRGSTARRSSVIPRWPRPAGMPRPACPAPSVGPRSRVAARETPEVVGGIQPDTLTGECRAGLGDLHRAASGAALRAARARRLINIPIAYQSR